MLSRRLDILVIGLFAAALALPVLDMATDAVDDPVIDENRNLAAFPTIAASKKSWRAFGPAFQDWFADHMGLRGTLVNSYRAINQELLGSADSVISGRDGWLFLLRDTVDYPERLPLPADLCGRNPFSKGQLSRWVEAIEANRRLVESLGAAYVLMIVPNKQTVHGEQLPGRIRCRRGPRRLEQLARALSAQPVDPLLDLESAFVERARGGEQLWHLTDTHWDANGALHGYRALIAAIEERLDRELPDAVDIGAMRVEPMQGSGWGLAQMLGRVSRTRERATTLVDVEPRARSLGNKLPERSRGPLRPSERFRNESDALPTVLALHDSFFDRRFKSLLAESFSRTDFVWHRGAPDIGADLDLVKWLKPDVVVHEMVERNLLHPYFEDSR